MGQSPLSQYGQTTLVDKEVDLIHCGAWCDDNLTKKRKCFYYAWCTPREKSRDMKQEQVSWGHAIGTRCRDKSFPLFFISQCFGGKPLVLFTQKDLSRSGHSGLMISEVQLKTRGPCFSLILALPIIAELHWWFVFLGKALCWQSVHVSLYPKLTWTKTNYW